MTKIIHTLAGKNNDTRHIHLNTYGTTPNMNDIERESHTLYIITTQYELNTELREFK